jgi:hypothetical protein
MAQGAIVGDMVVSITKAVRLLDALAQNKKFAKRIENKEDYGMKPIEVDMNGQKRYYMPCGKTGYIEVQVDD